MTDIAPETAPESQVDATEQPKTFDADYVANLRKEAAKYRTEAKANADAARKLAELEQKGMSEADKLRAERDDAVRRAQDAETASLRAVVALDKGLPAKLAARLSGASREELEADADELLALLGQGEGMTPDRSQGKGNTSSAATTDQMFAAFTNANF